MTTSKDIDKKIEWFFLSHRFNMPEREEFFNLVREIVTEATKHKDTEIEAWVKEVESVKMEMRSLEITLYREIDALQEQLYNFTEDK